MNTITQLPPLLTVQQACTYLGIKQVGKLKNLAADGEITHICIGKKVLFTHEHIAEYLAGHTNKKTR